MCANDQLGCNTNTALGVRMKMSAHRRRVPQQTQWRWTAAQTMQEAGGCHRGRLDEGAETDISEIVFLFYMAFSDWSPGFSIMASCCVPSIGTLFICSWFAWWNSTSRNTKFVPIPTWEKIIKNEHNVGFHSLQPLTGAFGRDINLNLRPFSNGFTLSSVGTKHVICCTFSLVLPYDTCELPLRALQSWPRRRQFQTFGLT